MVLLQQIINGLALGGVYSLIAIGWTVVFGVVGLINWTHGEVFMIGAFVGYFLISIFQMNLFIALILAMLASGLTAFLIDRLAYRPLRNGPRLAVFITALGASMFLRNLAALFWEPHARAYPATLSASIMNFSVGGGTVTVNSLQLIIFGVTLVIMIFLEWFITRTMMGKAMLAASQDFEMVSLMGVEAENLVKITFIVSGMLGGAAGFLVGVLYAIDPMMGAMAGLKGWAVAVLGGVGNISGAMVAGLLLGVAENISSVYISSGYRDAIAFVIMILTLIIKPTGLMGFKFEEKV
ncbi:ABC transporter permease [Anaerosporomusa subterranea]|jgi:branched-chain amino acid transport system permease protein|uniref:ABC transporter permease n=1 Tax=Anaerosporomusa subterranea TaxID=1794912 RepID=A0A154BP85_ANASB|nr:branched-chain amino acid ABC transporter permease [Anaerosporomusa subterranea]KYZ75695.1 ABC transporter permease [Anaerosporomusa subterranea]MDF2500837.1 ABC-type transporter, integral rane subunit [Anaerosporomusa subterranea]